MKPICHDREHILLTLKSEFPAVVSVEFERTAEDSGTMVVGVRTRVLGDGVHVTYGPHETTGFLIERARGLVSQLVSLAA